MQADRVYLELQLSKSVQADSDGNYLIEAEASNENLDFQDQVVLQRALMDSQDYFLKNGVISWDHLHKGRDDKGRAVTDPAYIIGEPISVRKAGPKTFVKAKLYRGNEIVEDLVSKLKAGATIIKTSVGGMRPVVSKAYDSTLGKAVEKVVSVLWDELALTYKPVNQTLSPVQFLKSMQLGHTTDSAQAAGGAALGLQDLDGVKRKKQAIKAIIAAIAVGDVTTPEAGRAFLCEHGISDKEADDMLEMVVNRRIQAKGAIKMDATLSKSFDEAVSELEKAMKKGGKAPMPPMPTEERPDEELFEEQQEEQEEEDEDEEGDEGQNVPPAPPAPPMMPPKAPMAKSREDFDDDVEFLDVSPVLASMSKSLKALAADNKALRAEIAEQRELVKSIGGMQLQTASLMKSMADQPEMRKSVITRQGRTFVGAGDPAKAVTMSRDEILRKSREALMANKMTLREASILEDRLNKGMDIQPEMLDMLKSL